MEWKTVNKNKYHLNAHDFIYLEVEIKLKLCILHGIEKYLLRENV